MKRSELAAMPRVNSWFSPLLYLVTMLAMFIAAAAASSDMASAPRPNCQHKCGDVPIPYPFSIGDNCSWPGFDHFPITCNDSFQPPRPYISNLEIINITIETAKMRVYTPVSYECFTSINQSSTSEAWTFNFTSSSPFRVSPTQNKFTALGCSIIAMLSGRDNGTYNTGCITYCASESEVMVDDGKCIGLGCCETSITNDLSYIGVNWVNGTKKYNAAWEYSPCRYAFVAEKVWHDFNRQDVVGNMTFAKRIGRGVPLVLDWAIRENGMCQLGGGGNACVSAHSNCFNATNGPGYFCKCSKGYTGNPYLPDGCKNINECELRKNNASTYEKIYPCHGGTCHDVEGGYECRCNFGRIKNSKNDKDCQLVLPKSAIAVIATICAISILAILLIFFHMEREKRKLRDFFEKNGGQLIKNMGIKIFTKVEMDQITKNYSTILGKGGFGEVYMGTIDNNQQVAVKRSITVDEARKNDFANEITIQAQISHKNVVRLLGCCLETNIPMLVYEFIPKGSLYDVLHGNITNADNVIKHPLSLQVRLGIAIESTEALDYMHSSANQKILHGDVKSSNILLDDKFTPRVSDFGISRLLSIDKHHTRFVIGDSNYIDPVYMKTGLLTEKSDVYSFGIVLLELITRKKARYDGNKSLPLNFVKSYMTESRAREMFDEEITSTEAIDFLEMIGRIAVQCLKEDVGERPTMKQVLEHLHLVRKKWMQRQGQMSCDQVDEIAVNFPPLTP